MRKLRGLLLSTLVLSCSSSVGGDPQSRGDADRDIEADDGPQPSDDIGDTPGDEGMPGDEGDPAPPVDRFAYVSGRGGLQRFRFDVAAGTLTLESTTPAGTNPSFLAISQTRRVTYVSDEAGQEVRAFAMAGDASLTPLGQTRPTGGGTAHISLDRSERYVFLANYGEGTVRVYPLNTDGSLQSTQQTLDAGQNAHAIVEGPVNHVVYVPCLGDDKVAQFSFASQSLTPISDVSLDVGAGNEGPRHIAIHPSKPLAYVLNELNSTLVAFRIAADGTLTDADEPVSTLPPSFTAANSGAEVQVAPSGDFVYTSNRGRNSIAIFRVASDGAVTLIGDEDTRGARPRHFSLDASGAWLFVANQDSDNVSVFSVDVATGLLTHRSTVTTGDAPQFVALVPVP